MPGYSPATWAGQIIEVEGKRLLFYLHPAPNPDYDTLVCEALTDVFAAIEHQVDTLDYDEINRFEIRCRWLTKAEWERERRPGKALAQAAIPRFQGEVGAALCPKCHSLLTPGEAEDGICMGCADE